MALEFADHTILVREDLRAQERAAKRGPALNRSRTPLPYSSRITGVDHLDRDRVRAEVGIPRR
ncbi:hypothetical protein SCALM49S_03943 [Streptomyces californicus]